MIAVHLHKHMYFSFFGCPTNTQPFSLLQFDYSINLFFPFLIHLATYFHLFPRTGKYIFFFEKEIGNM